MRNDTRLKFNHYASHIAGLSGVTDVSQSFTVEPAVQQTMEQRIQESSDFLSRINMTLVADQQGEKIGLGVAGPSASRTDTTKKPRQTRDLTTTDGHKYLCVQTNFDTHIPYARLDAWARHKDFEIKIRDNLVKRQALDRIMIGFNGVGAATDTNLETHPLLQDVNKGWMQQWRDKAAERVQNKGKANGKILIGPGHKDPDYATLDAAVFDLRILLDPWYQDDTQLVAIVGRGLLHDKYFPLVNREDPATEKLAADLIISQKRVGGLPAVTVPFFPTNTVLITLYSNLSIYSQDGARRRYIKEAPERNRVEFYESSNDAYVVEDFGAGAVLENIDLSEPPHKAPVTEPAKKSGS